jgi:hypothetical protein
MDARVRKAGHPMPEIAAFVAKLREAYGREVGTASPPRTNSWRVDESIHGRRYCRGCDGECVGLAVRCSDWLSRATKEKKR